MFSTIDDAMTTSSIVTTGEGNSIEVLAVRIIHSAVSFDVPTRHGSFPVVIVTQYEFADPEKRTQIVCPTIGFLLAKLAISDMIGFLFLFYTPETEFPSLPSLGTTFGFADTCGTESTTIDGGIVTLLGLTHVLW
jgi:hypothetical protein